MAEQTELPHNRPHRKRRLPFGRELGERPLIRFGEFGALGDRSSDPKEDRVTSGCKKARIASGQVWEEE